MSVTVGLWRAVGESTNFDNTWYGRFHDKRGAAEAQAARWLEDGQVMTAHVEAWVATRLDAGDEGTS